MQMQGIGGQRPDICQREEKEEFNRVKQDICKKCKYWKGIEEEKKKSKMPTKNGYYSTMAGPAS